MVLLEKANGPQAFCVHLGSFKKVKWFITKLEWKFNGNFTFENDTFLLIFELFVLRVVFFLSQRIIKISLSWYSTYPFFS